MCHLDDSHEITIRVRYCETDAMGLLHHATYVNYFEIGRTELFRSQGGNYREFEERGLFFVVVSLECKYMLPARYDDQLCLRTCLIKMSPAKLEHEYHVSREGRLLALGKTVLACVDREGRVQRINDELLFGEATADGVRIGSGQTMQTDGG